MGVRYRAEPPDSCPDLNVVNDNLSDIRKMCDAAEDHVEKVREINETLRFDNRRLEKECEELQTEVDDLKTEVDRLKEERRERENDEDDKRLNNPLEKTDVGA